MKLASPGSLPGKPVSRNQNVQIDRSFSCLRRRPVPAFRAFSDRVTPKRRTVCSRRKILLQRLVSLSAFELRHMKAKSQKKWCGRFSTEPLQILLFVFLTLRAKSDFHVPVAVRQREQLHRDLPWTRVGHSNLLYSCSSGGKCSTSLG